jgi:hypothetical protein
MSSASNPPNRDEGAWILLIADIAVEWGLIRPEDAAAVVLLRLVGEPVSRTRVLELLTIAGGLSSEQILDLDREADRQIHAAEGSSGGALLCRDGLKGWLRDVIEDQQSARPEDSPPRTTVERPLQIVSADRFHAWDLIARGGQGLVYSAEDSDLGRAVALKFLRPEGLETGFASPFAITPPEDSVQAKRFATQHARFVEEARRMSRLAHPGVPEVHGLWKTMWGLPFFAMPLICGETLCDTLRAGRISRAWGLEVLLDAADAVAYAHVDHDLVHSDLNPGNLMLSEFGQVFVLDWGAARYAGSWVDRNFVFATPGYTAPELLGGPCVIQPTVDVYALGVMLVELLTGQRPFAGHTPEAYAAAVEAHLFCVPVESMSAADERLLDLCRRCLSLDPGKRPQDAGEFADLLRHALEDGRRA